jgi:hypothetical protein
MCIPGSFDNQPGPSALSRKQHLGAHFDTSVVGVYIVSQHFSNLPDAKPNPHCKICHIYDIVLLTPSYIEYVWIMCVSCHDS